MQDSYGGILNIVFIVVFLVIVEGILGFIVSYTKAFRMKNTIISAIERYEGGCFESGEGGSRSCKNYITDSAKKLGYSPSDIHCPSNWTNVDDLFCYYEDYSDSGKNMIYSVLTQVDINIPIIKNIMGLSFFQVHGDTKPISLQTR